MIKLVVSDIDGTLIPNCTGFLPDEYVDIINKMKSMGIKFVAASGREDDSIYRLFYKLEKDLYVIADDGALVIYNHEALYDKPMDHDAVVNVCEKIRATHEAEVVLAYRSGSYYFPDIDPEFKKFLNGYRIVQTELKSYDDMKSIYKIAVNHNPIEETQAYAMRDTFEGVSNVQSSPHWLDFIPKDISKGNAIRFIQEKYSILPEETIVLGDSANDISMFKEAKYSYAVATAPDYVRAAASAVIPSYEEGGPMAVFRKVVETNAKYDN